MRILIVKPILPYPADQGTQVVTLGLLQALGRHHDVTLVCRLLRREEQQHIAALEAATGARVRAILAPNRTSSLHRAAYALGAWRAARRGVPRETFYDAPPALHAAVRDECAASPVDVAIVEYWHMAPVFASVRARRRVLLAHDAEASVVATRVMHAPPPRRAAIVEGGDHRIALERAACRAADVVWALTRADRRVLRAGLGDGTPPIVVLPFAPQPALLPPPVVESGAPRDATLVAAPPATGDAVPSETPHAKAPDAPPTVLFFGSFHASFNRDAAQWLLADIAPRIWAALAECRIVLAGSGDPGVLRRASADPRIEWAGYLDDPARALREATVVVLPLRIGGGLHVRLFDAWAQGAAVVTTSLGVDGVPFRDGVEVRVADDAAGFAAAVVDLARDPAMRHRLGAAARARLAAEYGSERVAERTRELLAAIGAGTELPAWALDDEAEPRPAGSHGGEPPTP